MTSNTYIFRFKILSSKYNLLSFQLAQLFYFHLLDTTETSKDLEHFLCLYLFIFTHFHTPLSCHKSSLLLLYCKSVKSLSLFFFTWTPTFQFGIDQTVCLLGSYTLAAHTTEEYSQTSHIGYTQN